jgi:hypothetical protein
LSSFLDAIDYRPDNFIVAPKEEWKIVSSGRSKKTAKQPRFCKPNCDLYIKDKDGKCGRFYECTEFIFDMHQIKEGDLLYNVLFATENSPPYDGLSWWVNEEQLILVMGMNTQGFVSLEVGRNVVRYMVSEYNKLLDRGH